MSEYYLSCVEVEIPSIGIVQFVFSQRAKHLSITIRHDLSIRVVIPKGITLIMAKKFFQSKINWVNQHLQKMQKQQSNQQLQDDLTAVNRMKAKRYLIERLDDLAEKYGFVYHRVFIKNQKTRWGSCSSKDNISLNMNLVRLPQQLQDYVILHELVHTRYKNHSKKFWAAMDELVGDSKQLRKQMRKYRIK
jgi:predicted metal-dependent hydrolase